MEYLPVTSIREAVHAFAASLPAGSKVIDVGCGLQPYKAFFTDREYVGLDVAVSGRGEVDKRADVYFDGENIPFDDASVDAILCTEVLEHAINPEKLISEMYRVLSSGGRVCVTVPFIWGLHEEPYDFRRYTPHGLAKVFSETGFFIDRQEKLTVGSHAIRKLIDSEVNNFLVNVRPRENIDRSERAWLNIKLWLHERMLRVIEHMWGATFSFERVYIDNFLVARKD